VLAALRTGANAATKSRSRIPVFAAVTVMLFVAAVLGARMSWPFVSDVQAAVRFEVRLAEERPAPGLRAAKVAYSGSTIYLHDEPIVTNSDIAAAQVVPGNGPSQYRVSVEFTASGAEKMRATTANHVGKPVAILLDGQVVMAPVVRAPIGASALITGNFTRERAEGIANGIRTQ
jgi:preprotein translocase subunit SecD